MYNIFTIIKIMVKKKKKKKRVKNAPKLHAPPDLPLHYHPPQKKNQKKSAPTVFDFCSVIS